MSPSEGQARPYRVLLVDDDEAVRDLIEMMLDIDDRFRIVGIAATGIDGVSLAARLQPDVVVLDLQMPFMDGLTAITQLRKRAPAARIVVFSAFPDTYTLVDVVSRGAHAYLDKAAAWFELVPTMIAACETLDLRDVGTSAGTGDSEHVVPSSNGRHHHQRH
jgi:DNA-binding NarL/FixJ family response regulator